MTRHSSRPRGPSSTAGWAGALCCLLAAAPALGQPLTVSGSLRAGEVEVGSVRDLRVAVHQWTSSTRLHFEVSLGGNDDKAAVLHAAIDAADGGAHVVGQVCSDVKLPEVERVSEGFAVTMLAGAQAQVVAWSKRAAVVRVPGPVPTAMEEDRLLPASALAAECRAQGGAAKPRPDLECEPFMLHPRPEESSAGFQVSAARRLSSTAGRDGWHRVLVDDFNGFRWAGFSTTAPKCAEAPPPEHGSAAGARVLAAPLPCRRALLPRGAVLRASDRKTPLLSVRRDFEALLCSTESAFEWEVQAPAGTGEVVVRGFFDGAPLPPPAQGR